MATYPQEAGKVKEKTFVVLQERPCKVISLAKSKPGKHGAAKVRFIAVDIITGKKIEAFCSCRSMVDIPNVLRKEYSALSFNNGMATLMTAESDVIELSIEEEFHQQVNHIYEPDFEGEVIVEIIFALGESKIKSVKCVKGPRNLN